ncbi:hypothetical protein CSA17_04205 [bacterium DOLJORAL78_65_58]|nr:MAG: hypothetical protein CSB20_00600 [bacterium DOLZORAL124_64_63]PIE76062.1 MAG: hypothetical protein CSA17_04205 [bacterium DOLJORAL78_65_58]
MNMRRVLSLLLPAVLLVLLAVAGCNDESNPKFSRIEASPTCGVAPMAVEFRAVATGGNETGDPTGGNNNLEINWNFGDGGSGATSIAYHIFQDPGVYNVVATAKDPDGGSASISQQIVVYADSLFIEASSNFPGGAVTTNDTIAFSLWAESCQINPDTDDDYRNLVYEWSMNDGTDTVFNSRQPHYTFTTAGSYAVTVNVSYTALAITRRDTLLFEVTDP